MNEYLTEIEVELLQRLLQNEPQYEALKKSLRNSFIPLAEYAVEIVKKADGNNQDIGEHLRAYNLGRIYLEKGFNDLELLRKVVKPKEEKNEAI